MTLCVKAILKDYGTTKKLTYTRKVLRMHTEQSTVVIDFPKVSELDKQYIILEKQQKVIREQAKLIEALLVLSNEEIE